MKILIFSCKLAPRIDWHWEAISMIVFWKDNIGERTCSAKDWGKQVRTPRHDNSVRIIGQNEIFCFVFKFSINRWKNIWPSLWLQTQPMYANYFYNKIFLTQPTTWSDVIKNSAFMSRNAEMVKYFCDSSFSEYFQFLKPDIARLFCYLAPS